MTRLTPELEQKRLREKRAAALRGRLAKISEELGTIYGTAGERSQVTSPADAADLLLPMMAVLEREEMWVLTMNARNVVLGKYQVYRGCLDNIPVRLGELFKAAILDNAAGIIVVHNHPSGDPTPSTDDVTVTRQLVQAGQLMDINLLDHVVIGGGRWVSLKERGLGF